MTFKRDLRGGCMRPLKLIHVLAVVLAALGLVSCKSIEIPTKKVDYKSATQLPSLEIPPDLTRPSADDRFTVPDINPRGTATFSEYAKDRTGEQRAAATSVVLPSREGARIERAGTQRWLVVKGNPDQLWQTVKDFWQETGFIVNVEIPEAGVMETDWAENRAKLPLGGIRGFLGRVLDQVYSTSERDKFRTRLERSVEPGMTEVYISHRGMEEVYTSASQDQTKWQPRRADADLEAEMLGRLMVRFGAQQDQARAQLAASSTATPRARLVRGQNGASTLAVDEQFDRAWRRVGLALDRVGFTVEDRDRSKGLYFVRYIDPGIDNQTGKVNEGWLSRFKFWGSSAKPQTEQYRILVKDVEAGAEVNVLNKEGAQEQSTTASRILTLLYEQLR
ncbi:MAG: outer membrane protein assembly factor BamC [Burkholderiales bacterium]|nr:outer membrane protein assembly factor BamC [Burkholderiales bacterium]